MQHQNKILSAPFLQTWNQMSIWSQKAQYVTVASSLGAVLLTTESCPNANTIVLSTERTIYNRAYPKSEYNVFIYYNGARLLMINVYLLDTLSVIT